MNRFYRISLHHILPAFFWLGASLLLLRLFFPLHVRLYLPVLVLAPCFLVGCALFARSKWNAVKYAGRLVYGPIKTAYDVAVSFSLPIGVCLMLGRMLTGLHMVPVYLVLLAILNFLILNIGATGQSEIVTCLILLLCGLHISCLLRWSTAPVAFVRRLEAATAWIRRKLEEALKDKPKKQQVSIFSNEKKGVYDSKPEEIQKFTGWLTALEVRVGANAVIYLTWFFLCLYVLTVVMVTVSFGSIYYLCRAEGSTCFSGLGSSARDAITFSFSVLMTSPFAGVQVVTQYEQMIVAMELACTLGLFTIFLASFGIGIGLQQQYISSFVCEFGKVIEIVRNEFELLRLDTIANMCNSLPSGATNGGSPTADPVPTTLVATPTVLSVDTKVSASEKVDTGPDGNTSAGASECGDMQSSRNCSTPRNAIAAQLLQHNDDGASAAKQCVGGPEADNESVDRPVGKDAVKRQKKGGKKPPKTL